MALIDKQLAGARLRRLTLSTDLLLVPAAGLIAGILLQQALQQNDLLSNTASVWLWSVLTVTIALASLAFYAVQRHRPKPSVLACAACVTFVALAALRLAVFQMPAPNDIQNLVGQEPTLATIRGIVLTDPRRQDRQWQFARFLYTDPATTFYLRLTEAETTEGWSPVSGTVRAQIDEPVLDIRPGDTIQAYCRLRRFSPPTNPAQFDVAGYLARKNVHLAASIKSRQAITVRRRTQARTFATIRSTLRTKAAQALLGDPTPEGSAEALLQALLLGYRGNIDDQTRRAFRTTGLLHFISLSGLHVGILVSIIWVACRTAGLLKPARALVCAAAIVVFLLIVPPRAPTLRAAIICWTYCAAILVRRRTNALNTLSLAAIITLLIRPTQLFEAGWQLSFATVLGILIFTEPIHAALLGALARLLPDRSRHSSVTALIGRTSRAALALFAVGLAAWLGGAGILLYHFHAITPLAPLWTVLVFPLVAAILTLGFAAMSLYSLLPTVASLLSLFASGLSTVLIWAVKLLAKLSICEIVIGQVSPALVLAFYGLLLFAMFTRVRRPYLKHAVATTVAALLIIFVGGLKWQRTHPASLTLTCLDVGHGQAILLQSPPGRNVLLDAGSLNQADLGNRVVIPFLRHSGISRLDATIISHNDVDHFNALPEIAASGYLRRVYAGDSFFIRADSWGTAKYLKDTLEKTALTMEPIPRQGSELGLQLKVLWPPEQLPAEMVLTDNDLSLVLLLSFAGRRILFCSDIESAAQQALLERYPDLSADVVIVPHHGSARTLDARFLESLGADVLVCSCGTRQYEAGQVFSPPPAVQCFYTARDGAVTVAISRAGRLRVSGYVNADMQTLTPSADLEEDTSRTDTGRVAP